MANVSGLISFSIKDALGVETSLPLYFEAADTVTLAQIQADAHIAQDNLDSIIDGQIISNEVKLNMSLDTANIKTSPVSTAEVERNALFNYSQANYKYKQGFAVPTIADAVIAFGKVDLSNSAVLTFVNMLINSLTYIKFTSKFLQSLLALLDVVISFRKHRKRETAVSFEED